MYLLEIEIISCIPNFKGRSRYLKNTIRNESGHLAECFRKKYRVSPSEYRRQHRTRDGAADENNEDAKKRYSRGRLYRLLLYF